jgi:Tat protein translocase TatB subunit
MFGMTFGEILVIGLVAMVVFGPRELPVMLRKVGQFAGKMRRTAHDLRVKSGIDDVLRDANITDDLNELRKLSRGELGGIDTELRRVQRDVRSQIEGTVASAGVGTAMLSGADAHHEDDHHDHDQHAHDHGHDHTDPYAHLYGRPQLDHVLVMERKLLREREYPEAGGDDYNAIPDSVEITSAIPASALEQDALYTKSIGSRGRHDASPSAVLTATTSMPSLSAADATAEPIPSARATQREVLATTASVPALAVAEWAKESIGILALDDHGETEGEITRVATSASVFGAPATDSGARPSTSPGDDRGGPDDPAAKNTSASAARTEPT